MILTQAWIDRVEGAGQSSSQQQDARAEYRAGEIESLANGRVSFSLVTPPERLTYR